jgi:hypothetical protein
VRFTGISAVLLATATCVASASYAQAPIATVTATLLPTADQRAVDELVRRVDIPYATFTLPNGLRVVVHTDRKAPAGNRMKSAPQNGFPEPWRCQNCSPGDGSA